MSFRVKFEEMLSLMPLEGKLILLDAYNYDSDTPELVGRAWVEIERHDTEGDAGIVLRLTFTLQIHPGEDDEWTDQVYVDVPASEDTEAETLHDWYDPSIERRIAVAWDLTRPVARTNRHIALWADNVLATDYTEDEPEDPMDRSLLLRHVAIGAGYWSFEDLTPEAEQPCAVFREVELLTRHHPGLFSPTRLEVREAEEAGLTAE